MRLIIPSRPTILAFALAVGVCAPFHRAAGTVESTQQAEAEEKLFAREMEMQREASKPGANDPATLARLGKIKITGVQWENTDVQAALADLKARSKAVDPDRVGFNMILDLPADSTQRDKLGRLVENNVCIVLSQPTSLLDLLNAISEQTNLAFRVDNGVVVLRQWQPGDCFCAGMMR